MLVKKFIRSAPIVAFAFGVSQTVLAQSPTTPSTNTPTANAPAKSATSATAKSDAQTNADKLARGDRKFIEEAAQGGMAEVELGKLAQQKASSDQVKQFAKRMVDDHQKANDQLKQIASSKGVNVPTELKAADRRELDKLQKLSGPDFDREYMSHMVSDHKKDVKEFESTAKKAKDNDIKNFAATTLPTLQQHLQQAQAAEDAAKHATRGGSKTSLAPGGGGMTTGAMSSQTPPTDTNGAAQHAATSAGGSTTDQNTGGGTSQRSTGSRTTTK